MHRLSDDYYSQAQNLGGIERGRCTLSPLNLLIMAGALVVLAVIWIVTLQRVTFEREQAVAAAMESNSNLAIAFEQQVYRTLKAAEQVATFVREQYLRQGPSINLNEWVTRGIIRDSIFNIVSLVNARGEIVSSSSQVRSQVNYADREFFKVQRESTRDELFISHPVLGRVSGRWQIPMSLRIARPDGGFAGVVVMSIDPINFTDFYRLADLGKSGMMELTGLDGVVRGRKIGAQNSFGMDAKPLSWYQRQTTVSEQSFVDDGQTVDAVPRIVSFRRMKSYPLMVTVGTAYADELTPVLHRRSAYFLLAAGTSLFTLVFAGLLVLMLTRQRAATLALQASEAVFRATFHQAAMGIAHIAPDGRILQANEKFCRMLGYDSAELLGKTIFDLSDASQREPVQQFLAYRLSTDSSNLSPEIEKSYRRKDGSIVWVCETLGVVKNLDETPNFLVAVTQDISARKELEGQLAHAALHDALTGLPNRVMFQSRLGQVLESARRHRRLAAILFIDLDGFKAINDSHGHAAGDSLLQEVARRLESCVRAEDTVSRFGGDEFGIVLASLSQAQDCEMIANKVIQMVATPFDINGAAMSISASVGAALYPDHGTDIAALLAHADSAMYQAKNTGKNRFSWEAPSSATTPAPP